MTGAVTVVIPTIPPRAAMLCRAVGSVGRQTRPAAALSIAIDVDHAGAWATRQRALEAVRTPWTAFLDDDDQFLPHHLDRLLACAEETGGDYIFPWFTPIGPDGRPFTDRPNGGDPFPGYFGRPWDDARPRQTTITTMVRTELAQAVGFQRPVEGELIGGFRLGEDYRFTLGCVNAGARFVHLPERTWLWRWHPGQTSGKPDRW
ncbi:Glycosyltransferase [Frankia sp. AiPs1]|uniref:glycosyltransferase family 2 protein n=1 Tax=Frankia sp. AiPa1 TaxID=573492 RepID=UPI00202B7A19|nr:glycosyltransferase [Frankia sp. AiPa1]MCL9761543.1 glycosyltransferase [Frankia sp. AiPa1]